MSQDNLLQSQILRYGKVIECNDNRKLGRCRVKIQPDEINTQFRIDESIYDTNTKDVKEELKWTRQDPFVTLPLLPFYIKAVPKPNELVLVMFGNSEYPQQNRFYIPGLVSKANASGYQNSEDAKNYLSDGTNYAEGLPIFDRNPNGSQKTDSFGIFPEPQDNAFLGRNSSDIIFKDNATLLRAGKAQLQNGVTPVANNSRAYLELQYFSSQLETDEKIKKLIIQEKQVKAVKFLLEFTILNPENTSREPKFTGDISIFRLKENKLTNSESLGQDSDVEQFKPTPVYSLDYLGLSKDQLVDLINNVVKGFNDGYINIPGYPVFRPQGQFPFYFRLGPINYIQLTSESSAKEIKDNIQKICDGVNPFNVNSSGFTFFGLVSSRGKLGPNFDIKIKEYQDTNYSPDTPITYGLLGADQVYLLSHKSEIPGKNKISIDGSIYGHKQSDIGVTIKNNTNSMVRGEQLLELLDKIVNFCLNHVHNYHLLKPDEVAGGVSKQSLRSAMDNAINTVLNKNIRIN